MKDIAPLQRRLDRLEEAAPPHQPSTSSDKIDLMLLYDSELELLRDLLQKNGGGSEAIEFLLERIRFRQHHVFKHHIVVPDPWSEHAEWLALHEAIRGDWQWKGVTIGRPLIVDTSEADVLDLMILEAVRSPQLGRGADIGSWNMAMLYGTPDDIAPNLARVKLNGEPMTFAAIGLDPENYPWSHRRNWESKPGRDRYWWKTPRAGSKFLRSAAREPE